MSENTLKLLCADPAFGLASFDPNCLFIQTYLKFAQVDYTVEPNPFTVPNYPSPGQNKETQLPILRHNVLKNPTVTIRGAVSIIEYLKSKSVDLDAYIRLRSGEDDTTSITLKEIRSEIIAYSSLVEEKLLPCLLYYWWVCDENYQVTKNEFFSRTPFYSRWLYAPLIRKQCRDHLKRLEVNHKNAAQERANECLSALNILLGNKTFFYGDTPSTLDALVYGYLACFTVPDLPDLTLRQLVTSYPNLSRFTLHILNNFESSGPSRTLSTQDTKKQENKQEENVKKSESLILRRFLKIAFGAFSIYIGYVLRIVYRNMNSKDSELFEDINEQSYHFDDHYEALTD
ncbi:metaxin [Acrasis kona]|uniref:Metaxin n=1 Tax=Acrasis kona TaxID=1008807 RepID=A0AAW2ZPM4_9EUKA